MSTGIIYTAPANLAVLPASSISSPSVSQPLQSLQAADQFNRNFTSQPTSNKNSSLKGNGKLWLGVLPVTGIAAVFTDWRTALKKIKLANPIKTLKDIGIAMKEMGLAILKFFGKVLGHIFDAGFYAPDLTGYLLEAGFHMLKFLVDIPFAIFG